ncbi:MAG TPA: DUF3786 domain-containing protein [Dehalococcoidales bacterium]|nr:DUF3786 domain-containing protein [Dehalococcoidales bacterium]
MARERLTVPERNVREVAHELAYRLAREQLAGIDDLAGQCLKSGARCRPSRKSAELDYLGRTYRIGFPGGEVSLTGSREDVPVRDKILLLHYFTRASGTPLSGRTITYKELPEGINYYPTFFKRAIDPIVSNFGSQPWRLWEIAERIGGRRAEIGDMAVTIDALPRVPVTPVLWRGDEEFAPDGNILFDSTIPEYLPTEDITILSEIIAWKLVRLLKTGGDNAG